MGISHHDLTLCLHGGGNKHLANNLFTLQQ
jgi:hypothetical protein